MGKRVKSCFFAVSVSSFPSEEEHLDVVGQQHGRPSGYLETIQCYFSCCIALKREQKNPLVFMMQAPIWEPQGGVTGIVSVDKNLLQCLPEEVFKAFLGPSTLWKACFLHLQQDFETETGYYLLH